MQIIMFALVYDVLYWYIYSTRSVQYWKWSWVDSFYVLKYKFPKFYFTRNTFMVLINL